MGYQKGRIFVDDLEHVKAVLFWHYCGFGYIVGDPNEAFLAEVCKLLNGNYEAEQGRFLLQLEDEKLASYFESQHGLIKKDRVCFRWNKDATFSQLSDLESDYALKPIDREALQKLKGRIIPAFSWESHERFLQKGKGFCISHQGKIISNAFSAAVSSKQIDIGVETDPTYRGKALAKRVAMEMVRACNEMGVEPLWSCVAENIGSIKTAESVGFEKCMVHPVYMKA